MTDLKYCFFCITNDNVPWLYELMGDLKESGVQLFSIDPLKPLLQITVPEGSYTITDDPAGVDFARFYDTGYSVYLPPSENNRAEMKGIRDAQCIIEGFDEITPDFIEKMYQRKKSIPWTILKTERTIIREMSLEDIDGLFTLYEDPEIKRFIPPLLPSKEEELWFQRAYIEKMYGFYGYGYWNVIEKSTGRLIGRAGLSNRQGFADMELGYLLSAPYRGRGIASEVCTAIIRYSLDILGAERLNAFIRPENIHSVRFAEKLGFIPTGDSVTSADHLLNRYVLELSASPAL